MTMTTAQKKRLSTELVVPYEDILKSYLSRCCSSHGDFAQHLQLGSGSPAGVSMYDFDLGYRLHSARLTINGV